MRRARNHPAWWAFLVHRLSGVALALFLPAHFLALGTALQGEARLDAFLRWTEQPAVIAAEWLGWRGRGADLSIAAIGLALAVLGLRAVAAVAA